MVELLADATPGATGRPQHRRSSVSPGAASASVGRYFLPTPPADGARRDRRRACFLCASADHDCRDCPNEACWRCGRPGHQSKDCSQTRSTLVMCTGCRRFGHIAAECPTKASYSEEELVDVRCLSCGVHGHLNCALKVQRALRLFCYNCGQRGHFGEDCHRPGMDPLTQRRIVAGSMAIHSRSSPGGPGSGGHGGGFFGASPRPGDRFRRHSAGPSFPGRSSLAGIGAKRLRDGGDSDVRDELESADELFKIASSRRDSSPAQSFPPNKRPYHTAPDSAPAKLRASDRERARIPKSRHGKKRLREDRSSLGSAARVVKLKPAHKAKHGKPSGSGAAGGSGSGGKLLKVKVKGGGGGSHKRPNSLKGAHRE